MGGTTRFFLNEEICSKLVKKTLYVVPPELDFPRNLTVKEINIKNIEKKIIEICFQEDVDYKTLVGKSLLIDQELVDIIFKANDQNSELSLIGKFLSDKYFGEIGKVIDVSGVEAQKHLVVDYEGKEIYVPYVEDIIINQDNDKIYTKLPTGLLQINEA